MKSWAGSIIFITVLLLVAVVFSVYNFRVSAQEPITAQEQTATPQQKAISQKQAPQANYIGMDKCATCHPQQFGDFQKRKFSKSWSVLKMRQKDKDPDCLKCHVTGYGQSGGFVSEEATPYLLYKQCEACHGPGSIHASNPGDATARHGMKEYVHQPNICTNCHRGVFAHRVTLEGF